MKFGVFYEMQYPRPWSEDGERKLFHESLEQVELADRLGFDYAWEVEHHFLEEYSHSSAPELFLAAASQRTKSIRLGHGICLLPPGYNQPARVAERVATLDILSNGRVELGTGESNSRFELEGYGVDAATKREQWQEALGEIANMLAMDPYLGHQGKHFSMPARNVVPKPVQKPHPPLWVACSNKNTIHLAARLGIGAMAFTFLEASEAKKWVDEYYEIFRNECVPIGHTVNPNILLVTGFGVHRDGDIAAQRFLDGIRFFQFGIQHYYREGRHTPGRTDLWQTYLDRRDELIAKDTEATNRVNTSRGAIGSVEQVRARMQSFADAGVDQLVFIQQAGKNRHEEICESLELFQQELMAEFREGDDERQARKLQDLEPFIEKAFQRKGRRPDLRVPDHLVPTIETIDMTAKYRGGEFLGSKVARPERTGG